MSSMINSISNQAIANLINEYLKFHIKDLPTYYYQIGNFEKNGLIINTMEDETIYYFNPKNHYFNFQIRLHYNKQFHQTQLRMMDDIINNLLHMDFKRYLDETGLYLSLLAINNKPQPLKSWVEPILESFDSTHQIYYINLKLVLKEI